MSELVEAIGLAMKEGGSKDERRAALGRALELAEAREALDVQAHGVAYGHAVNAIECAARDEDGWLDISELEPYEQDCILNDVAYLEARGLVVRHEERRELIQILPEESVAVQPKPRVVSCERDNCIKALVALSGAGVCTPEEAYGANSIWSISDLCRALMPDCCKQLKVTERSAR